MIHQKTLIVGNGHHVIGLYPGLRYCVASQDLTLSVTEDEFLSLPRWTLQHLQLPALQLPGPVDLPRLRLTIRRVEALFRSSKQN